MRKDDDEDDKSCAKVRNSRIIVLFAHRVSATYIYEVL